jgi:hypothetical protein
MKNSIQNGEATEKIFKKTFENKGFDVIKSNKFVDIYEHWDFFIMNSNKSFRVDVKGEKKSNLSRENLVWIEIKNVKGDDGWLYGGKTELIAFETENSFLLFSRQQMQEFVELNLQRVWVKDKRDALFKLYSREGRKDELTLVDFKKMRRECRVWEVKKYGL